MNEVKRLVKELDGMVLILGAPLFCLPDVDVLKGRLYEAPGKVTCLRRVEQETF